MDLYSDFKGAGMQQLKLLNGPDVCVILTIVNIEMELNR